MNGSLTVVAGALMATVASATVPFTAPAGAQESGASARPAQLSAERAFDIAAQPLTTALALFGQQSGLQVTVHGTLPRNISAPAIRGTMSGREALTRLLAGSGLTYVVTDETTVAIERPGQQSGDGPIRTGPIHTGPVRVEAAADAGPSDIPFITPGSSAYISREQIERIQPSSPGDIFIETPGVLSGSNHNGTQIDVNIRNAQGFNRVRVMVEGTQQDHSTYRGYAGADNRTYIDPELIGGVEITKGPGGGAYSSGTTGGIVNIRLLEAADLIREGRSTGFRVRGGLGGNAVAPRVPQSFDDIIFFPRDADTGLLEDRNDILTEDNWFASFAGAYTTDRFDLVAVYSNRKEGNYFAGKHGPESYTILREVRPGQIEEQEFDFTSLKPGQEIPNTSEDTESILFKGTLRLDYDQSLEAGFTRLDSAYGEVFPSSIRQLPAQQYGLHFLESNRYWLRYKWESENPLIDLQANLWGSNFDLSGELVQTNPTQTDFWGVEVWNTTLFDTPLGDLALNYGAEYTQSDMRLQTSLGDDVFQILDGERDVFGGYLNAALAPTDWLRVDAGVRYDSFEFEGVSANRGGCGAFDAEDCEGVSNSADGFSPRFGVTVEPVEGLQLFAQYSEGLRSASIVETVAPGFSPILPNPDLNPERLVSWEAGLNYVRDGLFFEGDAFRFKAVYFNNDYENFIAREFSGQGSGFQFTNLDQVTFSGYELTASYDAGLAFIDLTLAYFNEAEFCNDQSFGDLGCQPFPPFGENLTDFGQPEYSGTVVAGTRLLEERLVLGGRVNFFGENIIPFPLSRSFNAPSYWAPDQIIDLFGSYAFNDNLTLAFSVENITDRFYMTPLYQADIPAPGRTVRVNTTITF